VEALRPFASNFCKVGDELQLALLELQLSPSTEISRQVLATLGRQAAGETDLILLGGNYWAALFWSYLLVRGERSFSKASKNEV